MCLICQIYYLYVYCICLSSYVTLHLYQCRFRCYLKRARIRTHSTSKFIYGSALWSLNLTTFKKFEFKFDPVTLCNSNVQPAEGAVLVFGGFYSLNLSCILCILINSTHFLCQLSRQQCSSVNRIFVEEMKFFLSLKCLHHFCHYSDVLLTTNI